MKRSGINKLRVYIRRTNDRRIGNRQRKIKMLRGVTRYRQHGEHMIDAIKAHHYNIYLCNRVKE